jgi:hypothetical protein
MGLLTSRYVDPRRISSLLPELVTLIEQCYVHSLRSVQQLREYHLLDKSRWEKYARDPDYLIPVLRANVQHLSRRSNLWGEERTFIRLLMVHEWARQLHHKHTQVAHTESALGVELIQWMRDNKVSGCESYYAYQGGREDEIVITQLLRHLQRCYGITVGIYMRT